MSGFHTGHLMQLSVRVIKWADFENSARTSFPCDVNSEKKSFRLIKKEPHSHQVWKHTEKNGFEGHNQQ